MTLKTNARIAGIVFLAYIATGITSMIISRQVFNEEDLTAIKLAGIAQHVLQVRIDILLALLSAAFALILGVTLYALTQHVDRHLAILALCCRAAEGVIAVISTSVAWSLLYLATSGTNLTTPNTTIELLLKIGTWVFPVCATCFALGSTIFCYLFLRGRGIPKWLAWLGLLASILLVVYLPLQLTGFLEPGMLIWMPMLLFELVLAFWLIIKGVRTPAESNFKNEDLASEYT